MVMKTNGDKYSYSDTANSRTKARHCTPSFPKISLNFILSSMIGRFESRQGLGIFFTTASRPALGPTQPPIQWVSGAHSLEVKGPGREAILSLPNTPSWHGAQLKRAQGQPLGNRTLAHTIISLQFLSALYRLQGLSSAVYSGHCWVFPIK
jgi:hypothetical protein